MVVAVSGRLETVSRRHRQGALRLGNVARRISLAARVYRRRSQFLSRACPPTDLSRLEGTHAYAHHHRFRTRAAEQHRIAENSRESIRRQIWLATREGCGHGRRRALLRTTRLCQTRRDETRRDETKRNTEAAVRLSSR